MFPYDLRAARRQKGLTQEQAALSLGVSQAYLSMLENKRREVPARQLPRLVEVYGLSPSALPLRGFEHWGDLNNSELANELASLGYPGFSYMNATQPRWNPAELLVAGLTRDELESRVAEGLFWLAYAFNKMDWDWVVREAKTNDVTNRLGFVVTMARELADLKDNQPVSEALRTVETRLQRSTLVRDDTFCHERMTQSERRWLEDGRSPEARQWNVLSDFGPEHLAHVA